MARGRRGRGPDPGRLAVVVAVALAIAAEVEADGKAQQKVVLSGEGTAECPDGSLRILDETACKNAAKKLGVEYSVTYKVSSYPKGCFKARGSVYFNTDARGAARDDAQVLCSVAASSTAAAADDGESCPADASGGLGCSPGPASVGRGKDNSNTTACKLQGFDATRLTCSTCDALGKRLDEAGVAAEALLAECRACCRKVAEVESFERATLIVDASAQNRDQDLHDFIKRKAPRFSRLEVEYQEGAWPAIELESPDKNPGRVLRADVSGWKSDDLYDFLQHHLEQDEANAEGGAVQAAVWTAEIQTCSGWRLNQLPEVRRFIKEPGHADTYAGLKVNFIPHHNPDLVFFNEHGEEKERLDLGRYNLEQIHKLMEKKGFKKKGAKHYRGEIRTCSGWRLNQLPEVRKFVLGKGNADSYVGLKLNFIPHHSPVLVFYDEKGQDAESHDISDYTFDGLHEMLQSKGFRQKELL